MKKILNFVRRITLAGSLFFLRVSFFIAEILRNEFVLRNKFNRYFDEFYLRKNYSKDIARIFKGKLIHLDVGGRGGCLDIVKKYRSFFEVIMCEPEEKESNVLIKQGYRVIDRPLYKQTGKVIFYETYLAAGSSIYEPQGPYLDFYNPDPEYTNLYRVIKKNDIDCSTAADELKRLNVPELDFLKIDTQGSELDILEGLGHYRPLIMNVELQYLSFYHNVPSAYEVCQYLREQGYIPFALTSHLARVLCPTYGDGFFMPSWADPRGLELILSREEKYIALMVMFGQVQILKFINRKTKFKNSNFILSLH